jgi:hypothetical protein
LKGKRDLDNWKHFLGNISKDSFLRGKNSKIFLHIFPPFFISIFIIKPKESKQLKNCNNTLPTTLTALKIHYHFEVIHFLRHKLFKTSRNKHFRRKIKIRSSISQVFFLINFHASLIDKPSEHLVRIFSSLKHTSVSI